MWLRIATDLNLFPMLKWVQLYLHIPISLQSVSRESFTFLSFNITFSFYIFQQRDRLYTVLKCNTRKSWTIIREVPANKLGTFIIYPNWRFFFLISHSPSGIKLEQHITAIYRTIQTYTYRSSTIICSLHSALYVYATCSWDSIVK
jgi:hypothetical protein